VLASKGFQALPQPVRDAILATFGGDAASIRLIERSWRVRWHPRMHATTRRNRIYLRGTVDDFASDPALVLHEFFHVMEQWRPRRLTRRGYLWEWLRRGYAANRFEVEARDFAARNLGRFLQLLRGGD
jgi:hypothetical protein